MQKNTLVIFADYGLDDACATAYILAHREQWERIDIAPIGGNVAAAQAFANAQKLLAAAKADGLDISGVRLIDTTAMPQPSCPLPSIHGTDGLGDFLPMVSCSPVPVLAYGKWLPTLTYNYTVLSLGPCTVPAHLLQHAPVLPQGEIVIMGGCNGEEPNYNGYEFNEALDIPAFAKVLAYPHVCATLDTCRAPQFNRITERHDQSRLLGKLMNKSIALAAARHNDRCYIYDHTAALALCHPDRFTVQNVAQKSGVVMQELKIKE